jgi:hypothetical protein
MSSSRHQIYNFHMASNRTQRRARPRLPPNPRAQAGQLTLADVLRSPYCLREILDELKQIDRGHLCRVHPMICDLVPVDILFRVLRITPRQAKPFQHLSEDDLWTPGKHCRDLRIFFGTPQKTEVFVVPGTPPSPPQRDNQNGSDWERVLKCLPNIETLTLRTHSRSITSITTLMSPFCTNFEQVTFLKFLTTLKLVPMHINYITNLCGLGPGYDDAKWTADTIWGQITELECQFHIQDNNDSYTMQWKHTLRILQRWLRGFAKNVRTLKFHWIGILEGRCPHPLALEKWHSLEEISKEPAISWPVLTTLFKGNVEYGQLGLASLLAERAPSLETYFHLLNVDDLRKLPIHFATDRTGFENWVRVPMKQVLSVETQREEDWDLQPEVAGRTLQSRRGNRAPPLVLNGLPTNALPERDLTRFNSEPRVHSDISRHFSLGSPIAQRSAPRYPADSRPFVQIRNNSEAMQRPRIETIPETHGGGSYFAEEHEFHKSYEQRDYVTNIATTDYVQSPSSICHQPWADSYEAQELNETHERGRPMPAPFSDSDPIPLTGRSLARLQDQPRNNFNVQQSLPLMSPTTSQHSAPPFPLTHTTTRARHFSDTIHERPRVETIPEHHHDQSQVHRQDTNMTPIQPTDCRYDPTSPQSPNSQPDLASPSRKSWFSRIGRRGSASTTGEKGRRDSESTTGDKGEKKSRTKSFAKKTVVFMEKAGSRV